MYRLDTLAGLKSSLFFKGISFAKMPTPEAARVAKGVIDSNGAVPVEQLALMFYLLNHGIAELEKKYHQHEILPVSALKILSEYRSFIEDLLPRMVYYTLVVITRESRHLHSKHNLKDDLDKVNPEYFKFLEALPGGSTNAASFFLNHPPKIPLGDYVKCVQKVFSKGHFSSGYGGPAWGNIAKALLKFVEGDISPHTFLDTAWTLAHNNGPMFNKGFLFSMSGKKIIKVLDIQRSGQIPQFIYGHNQGWEIGETFLPFSVYSLWEICEKELGCFKGVISWDLVDKDGVGSYPSEKSHQSQHVTVVAGDIKLPAPRVYVTEIEYGEVTERAA
jgi:hypothetical protein